MEVEDKIEKTQGCVFDNSFSKINERFVEDEDGNHSFLLDKESSEDGSHSFLLDKETTYRISTPFAIESSEPTWRSRAVTSFVDKSRAYLVDKESSNKTSNTFATKPSDSNGRFGSDFTSVVESQVLLPRKENSKVTSNPFYMKSSETPSNFANLPISGDGNQVFLKSKAKRNKTSNPFATLLSPSTSAVAVRVAKNESKLLLAPPKLQLQSKSSNVLLCQSALPIQVEKLVKQTDKLYNANKQGGNENKSNENDVAKISCLGTSENICKMSENENLSSCISISSDNVVMSSPLISSNTKNSIFTITTKNSDENLTNVGFIFGQNLHERVLNYRKHPKQPSSDITYDETTLNKDELERMKMHNLEEKLTKSLSESDEEYEFNHTKRFEVDQIESCISISSNNDVISPHLEPSHSAKNTFSVSTKISDENPTNVGFIFGQNLHERVLNYRKLLPEESSSSVDTYHIRFKDTLKEAELEKTETQNLEERLEKSLSESAEGYESNHIKQILNEEATIMDEQEEMEIQHEFQENVAEFTEDFESVQFKRKFDEVDLFNSEEEEMEMQNEEDKLQNHLSESMEESESNKLKRKFDEVCLFEGKEPKLEMLNQEEKSQTISSVVTEDSESNRSNMEFDELDLQENKEAPMKVQDQEEKLRKSLSERAKEYESKQVKRKYEEVAVITGEEEEQNVLQINCKLFYYDKSSLSWQERGRGLLRLNDKESEGNRNSRLLMRSHKSHRVILNSKVWAGMSIEHSCEKAMQFTAYEPEGVKVFLVIAEPNAVEMLFHALEFRVSKLNGKNSASTPHSINDDENESAIEVLSSAVLHNFCVQESSDNVSRKSNDESDSSVVESDSCSETNLKCESLGSSGDVSSGSAEDRLLE